MMDEAITLMPSHLAERIRPANLGKFDADGFVLYWMRSALRTDENPALDVAKWLASHWDQPLLVYGAISEHYEYASDRHQVFMLQGARDVQRRLADLSISYAFHLATPRDRRRHLVGPLGRNGLTRFGRQPLGVLGQGAGIAAARSLHDGADLGDVDVAGIQTELDRQGVRYC